MAQLGEGHSLLQDEAGYGTFAALAVDVGESRKQRSTPVRTVVLLAASLVVVGCVAVALLVGSGPEFSPGSWSEAASTTQMDSSTCVNYSTVTDAVNSTEDYLSGISAALDKYGFSSSATELETALDNLNLPSTLSLGNDLTLSDIEVCEDSNTYSLSASLDVSDLDSTFDLSFSFPSTSEVDITGTLSSSSSPAVTIFGESFSLGGSLSAEGKIVSGDLDTITLTGFGHLLSHTPPRHPHRPAPPLMHLPASSSRPYVTRTH